MSATTPIADGTVFQFGAHQFRFGEEAVELTDSAPIQEDPEQLRARLADDGYLFIRGFHPREDAVIAAQWALQAIGERGGLRPGSDPELGLISEKNRTFAFFRQLEIAHAPQILNVVDSDKTFRFYERLFGEPVRTFDKRWLRCIATGGHNHFHYDSAYLGRGTTRRFSMWSALTPTDIDQGPLVVCLGSHKHQRLIETYGRTDMDRDLTDPVFSTDPVELVRDFGFRLATANFQPGDVVIFGLHTMHSSAPNLSDRYRVSIDTRYQPVAEPVDERFVFRDDGTWLGNFHNEGAQYQPMQDLRRQWGL